MKPETKQKIEKMQSKIAELKLLEEQAQYSVKSAVDSREYFHAKMNAERLIFLEETMIDLETDIKRIIEDDEEEGL